MLEILFQDCKCGYVNFCLLLVFFFFFLKLGDNGQAQIMIDSLLAS